MSFRRITWKTGDLVDVTRMNQYYSNDQYIDGIFSKIILWSDSKYWTETIGSNLNQVLLKIDSTQYGPIASCTTESEQANALNFNANIDISGLSNWQEYDIYIYQGHDNYCTSFIKLPSMRYLSWWVNVTRRNGVYGRMNLSILTSFDEIAT